jgi:hypothetical protein
MFLHTDPQTQLDIYHHRSDELIRQASEYRLARDAQRSAHRTGRWPHRNRREEPCPA